MKKKDGIGGFEQDTPGIFKLWRWWWWWYMQVKNLMLIMAISHLLNLSIGSQRMNFPKSTSRTFKGQILPVSSNISSRKCFAYNVMIETWLFQY